MGFPGYLWSTGIDFTARQRDLEAIFAFREERVPELVAASAHGAPLG